MSLALQSIGQVNPHSISDVPAKCCSSVAVCLCEMQAPGLQSGSTNLLCPASAASGIVGVSQCRAGNGALVLWWLKSCVTPASHKACSVQVTDGGQAVNALNELEWVDGEVWANIWLTNCIARIDPTSGIVKCALWPLQLCAS